MCVGIGRGCVCAWDKICVGGGRDCVEKRRDWKGACVRRNRAWLHWIRTCVRGRKVALEKGVCASE